MRAAYRALVSAAVLSVLVAGVAAAQDARLERLTPETRALVVPILDSVRAAGLPTDPLIDRALEGTSKGASPTLIAAVLRRVASELGSARGVLGPAATPAELAAAADALRAGATPALLVRLRDALGGRRLTVPLGVTADLIARGVPADTAAALLIARARSAHDAELLAFERNVARDIALGASPTAAATTSLLNATSNIPGEGGTRGPARHKP